MDVLLEQFKDYLTTEKHASDNTVTSYVRDVSAFCAAAHLLSRRSPLWTMWMVKQWALSAVLSRKSL